ncbi:MAG TPA: heat-inducible transcriptional repressor HrcA [Terriglobia bacterium]|nr:heat-inducible transcriptional repressor HrcA [Terriglobia bacterium]
MRRKATHDRTLGTLMTVVRTHIETGEPVGSRTVSRQSREGLSPASIRNIMMDLEEEGFLEQPYTSAGRVPTEKAYRFYASQIDPAQPPCKADEHLIISQLGNAAGLPEEEILVRTSHVLSRVSNNLGVVIRNPVSRAVLDHIHFVSLEDSRILVVLVSPGPQVQHHILRREFPISQAELEAASNYLNRNFRGWELERIRKELAARCAEERSAYDGMLRALRHLLESGVLEDNSPASVYLEGASNWVGRPELAKPGKLRELIQALEEKETVVKLLTECLSSMQEPLQVVVGLPRPPLLRDFALIGGTFQCPGGISAHMAVLGPPRMPYERAMRAMGFIGRLLQSQTTN